MNRFYRASEPESRLARTFVRGRRGLRHPPALVPASAFSSIRAILAPGLSKNNSAGKSIPLAAIGEGNLHAHDDLMAPEMGPPEDANTI